MPDISVGESYFIISGASELKKPAHIPWTILAANNTSILGMKMTSPAMTAIKLIRIKLFLLS